jgi:hypothetical protein
LFNKEKLKKKKKKKKKLPLRVRAFPLPFPLDRWNEGRPKEPRDDEVGPSTGHDGR